MTKPTDADRAELVRFRTRQKYEDDCRRYGEAAADGSAWEWIVANSSPLPGQKINYTTDRGEKISDPAHPDLVAIRSELLKCIEGM